MSDVNAQAQTTESGNQSQESAPDKNNTKNTESVRVETNSQQNGGAPKGLLKEVFKLREKSRTKDEEISSLRAELEQFKQGAGTRSNQKVDPLEDPDAYRAALEAAAAKAADERFNALLTQHTVQTGAVHAEKWLRSRSHINDDVKAGDEIAEIIQTQYGHLVTADPRAAARSAYLDWCESKGVTPDLSSSEPSLTPPRHTKPSAAGGATSQADKVYTPEEVSRMQVQLANNPQALAAYNADVVKAAREGRYKGKAIIHR